MRHGVVQRTVVVLSFDARVALELARTGTLPWLHDDEAALLRRVDTRAFRTDALRTERLFAALLEELPVSCALVGVDVARGFFRSKAFHYAILRDRLVVDAFGDWLFPRAGAPAQLEQAIALARRRRPRRRLGSLARAPGEELARVPAGTLRFFADARAALAARGATLHEAVARGARLAPPVEGAGLEHVLVVAPPVARALGAPTLAVPTVAVPTVALATAEDGPACSLCADALFALLSFARDGQPRAAVEEEARRLGADAEASALVDDLVADGLLAAAHAERSAGSV